MVKLYNVTDVRTGRFYSVAIVLPRMVKYFAEANV